MNEQSRRARRAAALAALVWATGCGGAMAPPAPSPSPSPTPSPTPTPTVSTAGLVLLFHMDEPAWDGTRDQVVDSSGQGHPGTATGGATTVAAGKFGRGGSFAGNASCVDVPDVPGLRPTTQLTIAAWILPTGLGKQTPQGIVAKRVDYLFRSAYAFFVNSDDRLTVDVDTENDRFEAGAALTNGRWFHVAMVYDAAQPRNTRVTVYVDGLPVGTGAETSGAITDFPSPLSIGCLPLANPAQGFVGTVDEVAIWHRALSAQEVATLAAATGPIVVP